MTSARNWLKTEISSWHNFKIINLATERERQRAQIKQPAWPMVELQIGHRKSRLVLSARFSFVNGRSRSVA